MTTVVYCHGFGSSPASKKASQLRHPVQAAAAHYLVPDLNVPSFGTLTLTAILHTLDETLRPTQDDIILVGSSLGGLSALHFYDRYRFTSAGRVAHLLLLAPVFDFDANRIWKDGAGWDEDWRTHGSLDFMNYSSGQTESVHYGLVEDVRQYDSWSVKLDVQTTILHGMLDTVVNPQQSIDFAVSRSHVALHLVESDHLLHDQTDLIERILVGLIAQAG